MEERRAAPSSSRRRPPSPPRRSARRARAGRVPATPAQGPPSRGGHARRPSLSSWSGPALRGPVLRPSLRAGRCHAPSGCVDRAPDETTGRSVATAAGRLDQHDAEVVQAGLHVLLEEPAGREHRRGARRQGTTGPGSTAGPASGASRAWSARVAMKPLTTTTWTTISRPRIPTRIPARTPPALKPARPDGGRARGRAAGSGEGLLLQAHGTPTR